MIHLCILIHVAFRLCFFERSLPGFGPLDWVLVTTSGNTGKWRVDANPVETLQRIFPPGLQNFGRWDQDRIYQRPNHGTRSYPSGMLTIDSHSSGLPQNNALAWRYFHLNRIILLLWSLSLKKKGENMTPIQKIRIFNLTKKIGHDNTQVQKLNLAINSCRRNQYPVPPILLENPISH
jgi:hypothetical protein